MNVDSRRRHARASALRKSLPFALGLAASTMLSSPAAADPGYVFKEVDHRGPDRLVFNSFFAIVNGITDVVKATSTGRIGATSARAIEILTGGTVPAHDFSFLAIGRQPSLAEYFAHADGLGAAAITLVNESDIATVDARSVPHQAIEGLPAIELRSIALPGENGSHGGFGKSGHPGHEGYSGLGIRMVNTAPISTQAVHGGAAIHAGSYGGSGGNGGTAGSFGDHGGRGGRGGNGGDIGIANLSGGTLTTTGKDAPGIAAATEGGEGGSAGGSGTFGSGNDGGIGGNGGKILIENAGDITTGGDVSEAIRALSLGGGGGTGSGGGWFRGGGDGGAGNHGGTVTIHDDAILKTSGAYSDGVYAASIGGDGGDAGASSNPIVSIGASGGKGGNGGAVSLFENGAVSTAGNVSLGLHAQSVGGGGGKGGSARDLGAIGGFAIGGSGGSGGSGDAVNVDLTGTIDTLGRDSTGILAQSIGGGGGAGGNANGVTLGYVAAAQVSIGGSGGAGGNGGAVTVSTATGARVTTGSNANVTAADTAPAIRGDHASGLVAQSIGGGGGKGGNALAVGVGANPDGPAVGASVAIGGSGGDGGKGDAVKVENDGDVSTFGRHAAAILAQSIGGGGGVGGNAVSVAAGAGEAGGSVSVGIGGGGGKGGVGGDVDVSNRGAVGTLSDMSIGMLAQSIGGGGGAGGNVVDVSAALGQNAASASVGVGGHGGDGGTSAAVAVQQHGSVVTQGAVSHGVVVQSIAGGGGAGGNVHTYAVSAGAGSSDGGGKALSVGVSVGGSGGEGGSGSSAVLTQSGRISTFGTGAHGAIVQSIGGGGGTGGSATTISVSAALNRADGDGNSQGGRDASVAVSVGGSGGKGGAGGSASFTAAAGSVTATDSDHADAVLVQSIGGGGGAGGHAQSLSVATTVPNPTEARNGILNQLRSSYPDFPWDEPGTNGVGKAFSGSVAVGGKGGSGGRGGAATATLDAAASILTAGDTSHAVVVQSIGGGGGRGGAAFSDAVTGYQTSGLTLAIGGHGGTGNHGGAVSVAETGSGSGAVATLGDNAHGIVAQSIGGGGGAGGTARSRSLSIPKLSNKTLSIALGGSGGASGDGGTVSVTRNAAVTTAGEGAIGILAQSVGGGGGEAHHALGQSDTQDGNPGGSGPSTGGGAEGAGLLAFSLGGSARASGKGGSVAVAGSGVVSTGGSLAHAVVAQSIGGGGGAGGSSGGGFFGHPVGLSVHLGGSGGGGGNGGAVSVKRGGAVTTGGDLAIGVLAQSIGGGGGAAGAGSLVLGVGEPPPAQSHMSLSGGSSGEGGTVSVADTDVDPLNVTTTGAGANAIFAQSVGGGGGLAMIETADEFVAVLSNPSRSGGGAGGDVGVTTHGVLSTTGDFASAIFAQSAGGGMLVYGTTESRGFLSNVADASGSVTVWQAGTIATAGKESHGIEAMAARAATNAVSVTVGGAVTATGADARAIQTTNDLPKGGRTSSLTTTSIVVSEGAAVEASGSGSEAAAIFARDRVGRIAVSIAGAATASGQTTRAIQTEGLATVDVLSTGMVRGDVIDVQRRGTLSIAGTLRGRATVGEYRLETGGTHAVPMDLVNPSAAGASAKSVVAFDGTMRPYLVGFGSQTAPVVLLMSDNDFTADLTHVVAPAATSFTVSRSGNELLAERVAVSFSDVGLTGNSAILAAQADTIVQPWMAGGAIDAADADIGALLLDAANAPDAAGVASALQVLDASSHYRVAEAHAAAGSAHVDALMSCGVTAGDWAAIAEGECRWFKATAGQTTNTERHASTRDAGLSLGVQGAFDEHWRLGFGLGYERTRLEGDGLESDGHRLHAGVTAKYTAGPWLFSAALSASRAASESVRAISHSGGALVAEADHQSWAVSGRLRAAHLVRLGGIDVKPMLDLDMAYVEDRGYRERGAGSLNIAVAPDSHLLFDLHPTIGFSTDMAIADGGVLRPYLQAGARIALNDTSIGMSLPDSLAAAGSHDLVLDRDRVVGTLGVGVSLFTSGGLEARLGYEGAFGDSSRSHRGSLKLGFAF
jgi:uncharacterized protein YhjY with autotransporter beta-barrel domain